MYPYHHVAELRFVNRLIYVIKRIHTHIFTSRWLGPESVFATKGKGRIEGPMGRPTSGSQLIVSQSVEESFRLIGQSINKS